MTKQVLPWFIGACMLVATQVVGEKNFTILPETYSGPVAVDFLTTSTVVVSERTSLSLVDLNDGAKTKLVGSLTTGGYVDGDKGKARFTLINDVVIQGSYIYIADFSCIRIYDMLREQVATLAGICGRMEGDSDSASMFPTFRGQLKLAASARDLYVLDQDKISRVDKETGAVWLLSVSQFLADGDATSIALDKYSKTLFVAVATTEIIHIVAIDAISGLQTLYQTVLRTASGDEKGITAIVASLDVDPQGKIYVLEPHGLHEIDEATTAVTSWSLKNYGYHEIAVSSAYLVITQEYYSRMYRLQVLERLNATKHLAQPAQATEALITTFESKAFYIAVIFPSILFLLVIIVVIGATWRILKSRKEGYERPVSDVTSDKYFLNEEGNRYESKYWM
ncbi:uncharacterized protein [Watersipora subatra]|uniref:uncharacterized protein n=1 Tax=Watersipora subatra TaxID=2589382 RepID=UPI00355B9E51